MAAISNSKDTVDHDNPRNGVIVRKTQSMYVWTISVAADNNTAEALREAFERARALDLVLREEYPDDEDDSALKSTPGDIVELLARSDRPLSRNEIIQTVGGSRSGRLMQITTLLASGEICEVEALAPRSNQRLLWTPARAVVSQP
jgi:hypothetical protein